MTPEELRASIPAPEDVTYKNFGASGPSPRPVVEAAESFLEYHEFDAPSGEGMYPAAFDAYEDVRETVADFVGADAAEIALTQSTTDGINRLACAQVYSPCFRSIGHDEQGRIHSAHDESRRTGGASG